MSQLDSQTVCNVRHFDSYGYVVIESLTLPWSPGSDAHRLSVANQVLGLLSDQNPEAALLDWVQSPDGTTSLHRACVVLNAISIRHPAMAVRLTASLAANVPLWGAPGSAKKVMAEGAMQVPSTARLAMAEAQAPIAVRHGTAWALNGVAPCFEFDTHHSILLFATTNSRKGMRRQAFLLAPSDLDAASVSLPHAPWFPLQLHNTTATLIKGLHGDAADKAQAQALALTRIFPALLMEALCTATFEVARAALANAEPSDATRLADCVVGLSGLRLLLQESVRHIDTGGDSVLLSTTTALAAVECAEKLTALAAQLTGGISDEKAAHLHHLLVAYRAFRTLIGGAASYRQLLEQSLQPISTEPSFEPPEAPSEDVQNAQGDNSSASNPDDGKGERIHEILDAAAEAFTRQSYDATSLDHIGDVIGATKGSIYYHYRSKADLFLAVYRRALEMNFDVIMPIAQAHSGSPLDKAFLMVRAHAMQVMRHLSYQRVAMQGLEAHLMNRVTVEQRSRLDEVIAIRDRYEDLFVKAIQDAVDAGELPEQNVRMAVKPLMGSINWATIWYRQRPAETTADRERLATELATFVISGLTLAVHLPMELG